MFSRSLLPSEVVLSLQIDVLGAGFTTPSFEFKRPIERPDGSDAAQAALIFSGSTARAGDDDLTQAKSILLTRLSDCSFGSRTSVAFSVPMLSGMLQLPGQLPSVDTVNATDGS